MASNYPPNSKSRVERTRKAEKCQWCGTKVPLKEQYTVRIEDDKVIKRKDCTRKAAEGKSHWCGDCAAKRVKMSERYLTKRQERNGSAATKKKAAKPSGAKKSTAAKKTGSGSASGKKAATGPKKRRAKKAKDVAAAGKTKGKATATADPF